MKKLTWLLAMILPVLLTACGTDHDFQGRFIEPDGLTSYEFLPDGKLQIAKGGEDVRTAHYQYDPSDQIITLSSDLDLSNHFLKVNDAGNLEAENITMTRGVDYGMLADSTWIGQQDEFTFALTFTETNEGMAAFSELVTYYEDEKTYLSQTDDSIARLSGNMLFIDLTQYTVSEVTSDSFKITIGDNSMLLEKQPKDTGIEYREGYQATDEEA